MKTSSISSSLSIKTAKKTYVLDPNKVSVGLVEHFNTATRDFDDAMTKIECEMYDEAKLLMRRELLSASEKVWMRTLTECPLHLFESS